jgi:hypothetical protein
MKTFYQIISALFFVSLIGQLLEVSIYPPAVLISVTCIVLFGYFGFLKTK